MWNGNAPCILGGLISQRTHKRMEISFKRRVYKDESKTKKQLIQELNELRVEIDEIREGNERWKHAEQTLLQSESRLRLILQIVPSFIVESDLEGKILSLNKTQPGFSLDDFIGISILDAPHPKGRDIRKVSFNEVIEKCIPVEYEAEDYGPDRSQAWYRFQLAPVTENGEIKSVLMLADDITERKQADEALQESEKRYQALAEVSPVGIFHTDAAGNFLYVNEQWCMIAGMTAEEAQGEGWAQGLHPEDRERVFKEWT